MTRFFDPQLEKKPDFVECMQRIYAWYDHQVLDRAPIRFAAHNADFNVVDDQSRWASLKDRWFDVEYQVERALKTVECGSYLGETFPLYWPNLGPNVYAGIWGADLEFGDVTSWCRPLVGEEDGLDRMRFDLESPYLKKINALTDYALERCAGKFLVGYTDVHPSFDCTDALMGTENMFFRIAEEPEFVQALTRKNFEPFFDLMDAFHKKLHAHNQLSVSWMQIPSYETMHIPSCDLGAMISREMFDEFALPYILEEVKHFRHNIFHVDGKGVARHLDAILDIPEIQAYQWVQGVGEDRPILQWVPLIRRIQEAGKSVVVDLHLDELEPFMGAVRPEGILLCMDESDPEIQKRVVDRLLRWK